MNEITEIIREYYEGHSNSGDAEARLVDEIGQCDLAAFIMDAFVRGWITPFNLGIK